MKNSKNSCLFSRMASLQRLFFIALFSALSLGLYAQNKTVSGTVVDGTGETVIGASVLVKGTTNGVITDIDGNFTLNDVPANGTIQVSYVGYKTQDVSVAGKTVIKVTLQEDTEMLDEVVVVGYGVQKKSDVTGALTRVDAEALNARPVSNAFEALQGKAAGVDITSNERPGEIGSIRIRGNRSLNASNSPLYVVDGVPLASGGIESLNPRDIESIDILKDASSTAIYGSRGANGVVLITTKRGKVGALSLTYNGTLTLENLVDKSPAMSASDYITWRRWAYYNQPGSNNPRGDQPDMEKDKSYFSGDNAALANIMKGWSNGTWDGSKVTDTDWTDMVTQTGITHEHTLSATGGTENIQSAFSFGYLNNQGTQKGQEYERYNVSMSVDIQAKPWLKMGGSVNASYAIQDYGFSRTGQSSSSGPTDIYGAAKAIPRYTVPYDEDGDIILQPGGSTTNVYTVIDEWKKSTENRQTYRALGSFYAQVDFGKIWKPLEGLTYKFAFGPDFRYYRRGIFIDSSSAVKMGSANYASWNSNRYFSWTLDNMVMYNKKFGEHSIGVTLVQSASKYNMESANMSEKNVLIPEFLWNNMGLIDITDSGKYGASMGTGKSENQLASYLARVNYSFKDRYLLTISGRYDGSSVLAEGNKWAFFPSAALGWRIDQEDFMKDISWVDQLKLRFGVGATGNSSVGAYGTLGVISAYWMPFSTGNSMIFVTNEPYYSSGSNKMPNKKLGWEKTTQFNYGVDFSFLKGRIGGTLDIYHTRTTDLLMQRSIPSLTGYPSIMSNVGETKNFGIEVTLNTVPLQIRDFQWNSDLNFAYQKDEIVELATGKQDDISNAWFIGESIAVHYGIDNEGLWKKEDAAIMEKFNANGHKFEEGMVRPKDQNNDFKIDDEDRVILGNRNPTFTAGWSNTFSWKGFDLSVELYGRFGYMVSTGGEGQLGMYQQREIDYWTPDNTDAEWQKPIYNQSGGDGYSGLLGFKDASFIKIRNVSLGYNFSKNLCKKMGIGSLKAYVQGKNLGNLYSSIDFLDLDLGTTFYNRGVTFGLSIGF
ncbi:MAG: TonB-dependent receptor [Mediterranea massiliensis]|nr:TonB-dependent receptor [Mediterranea massiliensis]